MSISNNLNWRQLFLQGFAKAFDYKSKSTRAAYWSFVIGCTLILLGTTALRFGLRGLGIYLFNLSPDCSDPGACINAVHLVALISELAGFARFLFILGSLVAHVSLTTRRLRDLSMNPWLTPVFFIPCAGIVLSLIFFTRKAPALPQGEC